MSHGVFILFTLTQILKLRVPPRLLQKSLTNPSCDEPCYHRNPSPDTRYSPAEMKRSDGRNFIVITGTRKSALQGRSTGVSSLTRVSVPMIVGPRDV